MTVNSSDIDSGPYSGNDVVDEFDYTFTVQNKTQLTVWETDDQGVETALVVDTHYTVNDVGTPGGGTVTRIAGALPTGYTWYIRSNYQYNQLISFESQGGFFPAVHENAIDKLTYLILQLLDGQQRSIKFASSESGGAYGDGVIIDTPVDGQYLQWVYNDVTEEYYVISVEQPAPPEFSEFLFVRTETGDFTLAQDDNGYHIMVDKASAVNVTIPDNDTTPIEIGTVVCFQQYGAGFVYMAPENGNVTVNVRSGGAANTDTVNAVIAITKVKAQEWIVTGDVEIT